MADAGERGGKGGSWDPDEMGREKVPFPYTRGKEQRLQCKCVELQTGVQVMAVGGRQSRDQVSTKKQEETEKTKNEHGHT